MSTPVSPFSESIQNRKPMKCCCTNEDDDDKAHGKLNATYFAESTSIPGLHKIWASPLFPLKVMWCLLFMVATGVVMFQLYELFRSFYSFPIKTSIKLGFSPLPFPSVTICNSNPIRLSKANQLGCGLQKALELDTNYLHPNCLNYVYTLDYNDTETELYCDETGECYEVEVNGLDKQYIRSDTIADLLAGEDKEVRRNVGHDINNMLMECSLNGRSCGVQNFTQFLSKDLGNCYTFNSNGLRAKKSGPETGLSMVLNLEPEEFIESFMTGYGLRVVVHERGTRAFPGSEGFTASAGSETSATMKLFEISRIGEPHGNCNESTSFKKKFGVGYTERTCREFCQKSLIIDKCGCISDIDESISTSTRVCSTDTDWDCEDNTLNKYSLDTSKGIDVCKCNTPCSEKVYDTKVTSRAWPVLSHVNTLESQACDADPSSFKCNYTSYDFNNVNTRIYSFIKLKVYFESLNFETVLEEQFYTTERFLSDIGGTLGLWIGASVLSLAEVLEVMAHLCLYFLRRK